MAENSSSQWSEGLRFIQSKKNRSLHAVMKTSPYEAMSGSPQKIGLADSPLPTGMYASIETEEELEQLFSSINNNDQKNTTDENRNEEVPDNFENEDGDVNYSNTCVICEKETSEAHKCSDCNKYVHVICGESSENDEGFGANVICKICLRKKNIDTQRECAKIGQEKQAKKMIAASNSKFSDVDIGTNVAIRVPDVDRGRVAPRNVLAVVLTKNSFFLYVRNEFVIADNNFINIVDVPSTSITLRSALMLASGSKESFIFCLCKRYCIDKRCKCRLKNIKFNSKCHNNSSCKNK